MHKYSNTFEITSVYVSSLDKDNERVSRHKVIVAIVLFVLAFIVGVVLL